MLKENKDLNLDTVDEPEDDDEVAPESAGPDHAEVPPSESESSSSDSESEPGVTKKKQAKKSKGDPKPPIVKLSKAEIRAKQREEALKSAVVAEDLDTSPKKKGKRKKKGTLSDGTGTSTPVRPDPENDLEEETSSRVNAVSVDLEAEGQPQEEGEEATAEGSMSKRERRKAKEAAKNAQKGPSSTENVCIRLLLPRESNNSCRLQQCNVCHSKFDSRTQLFSHIRTTGHAAASGDQMGGSGKTAKGKKR